MLEEAKRVLRKILLVDERHAPSRKLLEEIHERELKQIESEAYRKVQEVEGAADAKATSIYAKAYNQTPEAAELFEFLKTMEAYKAVITPDTTLILSTDSRFLRYLKSVDDLPAAASGQPGTASSNDPLKNLPTLMDLVKQQGN